MHLDCVFSILGDKCCIMLEEMLGAESKTRRLVDEYSRHPSTGGPTSQLPRIAQTASVLYAPSRLRQPSSTLLLDVTHLCLFMQTCIIC